MPKPSRRRSKSRTNSTSEDAPSKPPRTVENSRTPDVTRVAKEGDPEVQAEEHLDEFADHFLRHRQPKLLITTNLHPGRRVKQCILEMLDVFPVAIYYSRRDYPLTSITQYAIDRDFTALLVFNEDNKEVNGLFIVALPYGPTANFRIRNLKLRSEIRNCGTATGHKPEMILNNFDSRLGYRLGRLMVSLFPQKPEFRGRQVATFHNQRDFIFFRHHRYVFEEKEREEKTGRATRKLKVRLQELGPRFTMKLASLQKGTFDAKYGEYEWIKKRDMRKDKKRFDV